MTRQTHIPPPQSGATVVEFTLVLMLFLGIVFGILEFGRLFYVANTVQEVTRRAAREQVVKWVTDLPDVQRSAVFGSGTGIVALPAGAEVTSAAIAISFHGSLDDALDNEDPITGVGGDPVANVNNCLLANNQCIRFVRASLESNGNAVHYAPMIPLFSFLDIPIPGSTVVMPAEAMGLP